MDGGAGVVVTRGNPTSPRVVKTIRRRGARFTCFYEEEKSVLEGTVDWLQTSLKILQWFRNSQFICLILLVKFTGVENLKLKVSEYKSRYSDILGNGMADYILL